MFTDFEHFSVFKPAPAQENAVNSTLDQVITMLVICGCVGQSGGVRRHRVAEVPQVQLGRLGCRLGEAAALWGYGRKDPSA